jgi:hypothetical protein
MAKKAAKGDRNNPKENKGLEIRTALAKMPNAKGAEIAAAVKEQYGHTVTPTLIYLVKSKSNVKATRRGTSKGTVTAAAPSSTAEWVESIKVARRLLQATGSVESAVAILKAVEA